MKRLALALAFLAGSADAATVRTGLPVTRIGAPKVTIAPNAKVGLGAGVPVLTPTINPALTPSLTPSVVPSIAPAVGAPAAEAPNAIEVLQGLAAPAGQSPLTPDQAFDGAGSASDLNETAFLGGFGVRRQAPSATQAAAPSKNKTEDAKLDDEDKLDELQLMYAGTSARALLDSHIWGDVKFIKPTEGSKWWWNKFKKGETIRIKAGSDNLFQTQLTDARTKAIGDLTKDDLAGIFTSADIARNPVSELRKAVIERLTKAHKGQFVISLRTQVRLLHFKTPKELAAASKAGLPAAEIYDPFAPRKELKLPADSKLRRLNQFYPKAVLVDLDLFGDKIPPEVLEDMGKLQRSGVKFVFFSNTTGKSYKSLETQIKGGLYGSIFAYDGGALITAHSREQVHTRTADLLTDYDRDVLLMQAKLAAYQLGASANEVEAVGTPKTYFEGKLPASVDAGDFKVALEQRLEMNGLRGQVILDGKTFRIQHRQIATSMSDVLSALQQMGVYANPQEILVVSNDPKYASAVEHGVRELLPQGARREGAIRAAADAKTLAGVDLSGVELLENALGAVLGEYRQNVKGDFVTSASALDSFAHYTDRYFSQELLKGEENVYAFWGHETHDVMNWVAWVHRNTGRVPTEEEAVERHRRQWDEAIHSPELAVYLPPGRDFVDLREAAIGRLRGIYQLYTRIMSIPGAHFIGTEVPNTFVLRNVDRKKGETRRVFIRTIFDFAALIPSKDGKGMELWIMDFKSGVKPTQEVLAKKIQPRTYRLFTSYKWSQVPREYDIAGDDLARVTGTELEFIYNRTSVYIPLNNWDDRRTELEILRLAERMRQDKQRTHIRTKKKRQAAKKKKA